MWVFYFIKSAGTKMMQFKLMVMHVLLPLLKSYLVEGYLEVRYDLKYYLLLLSILVIFITFFCIALSSNHLHHLILILYWVFPLIVTFPSTKSLNSNSPQHLHLSLFALTLHYPSDILIYSYSPQVLFFLAYYSIPFCSESQVDHYYNHSSYFLNSYWHS